MRGQDTTHKKNNKKNKIKIKYSELIQVNSISGKGGGSFLGGISFGAIGARLTFRFFGISSGICGIIFFLIDYYWMREIVERRLMVEKSQRDEAGGEEITFRKISITRRPSIFDANPFSQTITMISLKEIEED